MTVTLPPMLKKKGPVIPHVVTVVTLLSLYCCQVAFGVFHVVYHCCPLMIVLLVYTNKQIKTYIIKHFEVINHVRMSVHLCYKHVHVS